MYAVSSLSYTHIQHNYRCERNNDSHPYHITDRFGKFQSHYHVVMGAHHRAKPLRGNPDLHSLPYCAKENTQDPQLFSLQVDRHPLGRMWRVGYAVQRGNDDPLRV